MRETAPIADMPSSSFSSRQAPPEEASPGEWRGQAGAARAPLGRQARARLRQLSVVPTHSRLRPPASEDGVRWEPRHRLSEDLARLTLPLSGASLVAPHNTHNDATQPTANAPSSQLLPPPTEAAPCSLPDPFALTEVDTFVDDAATEAPTPAPHHRSGAESPRATAVTALSHLATSGSSSFAGQDTDMDPFAAFGSVSASVRGDGGGGGEVWVYRLEPLPSSSSPRLRRLLPHTLRLSPTTCLRNEGVHKLNLTLPPSPHPSSMQERQCQFLALPDSLDSMLLKMTN